MDFIREIDEMVMSSSSEEDFELEQRVVDEQVTNQRPPRRPYRQFKRACVNDYDDVDFRKYYRLKKEAFWRLHSMVGDELEVDRHQESLQQNISCWLCCVNLRAAIWSRLQPTTSGYLNPLLLKFCHRFVMQFCGTFLNSSAWLEQTKSDKKRQQHSPRCLIFPVVSEPLTTHVRIISPGGSISEAFRNRHGYFSINVQTISDAKLRIQNVVPRWPGSAHDQTIFRQSNVHQQLENGIHGGYVIVADSGYANTLFECTPFTHHRNLEQLTAAEKQYQKSILTTRNVVERQYGVLKRRFPILATGINMYRLDLVQKIIAVCCILHNLCIDFGDVDSENLPLPPHVNEQMLSEGEQLPNTSPPTPPPQIHPHVRRLIARQEIVNVFAQRLAAGIRISNAAER